ncbi:MAG: molybdopterin-dependent oxidoreductase [Dehalococcoidia bacterium]|nr:molybdopterin-dependent oxidoreductase [Dehalococcoidia bacterium]MDP7103056.1 molybdopterin-dependent oxidoreductase [SAR202 cluster bacterium]
MTDHTGYENSRFSRRQFLKISGATLGAAAAVMSLEKTAFLQNVDEIENPLEFYPSRNWEHVYRDQYRTDYSFSFVCAPNDTHNCRLRAHVRNGVITRIEQAYDVSEYRDLDGNKATATWHPRGCLKGLAYARRVYSPNRIKTPVVRKGWKQWRDDGFPRLADGLPDRKYFKRGEDEWVPISWAEGEGLVAQGMTKIAADYSSPQGADWLKQQGFAPEMIETLKDADGDYAGVRTFKMRGGMAFLGATRLAAAYRFSNMLALLDNHIRGKGPEKSMGTRMFDNYAWHTDLPPGHPMVHGAQTFDQEFHDFWNSDLIIMTGLNLVSNKMADPIWWQAAIERNKKIVVIAPEYSASSPKGDYWLSIRQGTDTALMLGVAHLLIRDETYDATYIKRFSDFPMLVREDNLKMLRLEDLTQTTIELDAGDTWVEHDGENAQKIDEPLKTTGVMALRDGRLLAPSRTTVGQYLEDRMGENGLTLDDIQEDWQGDVQTVDGPVRVRSVLNLYRELTEEYTPENVEKLTTIKGDLVRRLTDDIVAAGSTAFLTGMGMNMYFHNDLINRAYYVVATLTGNVGKPGGNVGSYAGNYKAPVFNGTPSYVAEDPFAPTLDPTVDGRDIKKRGYSKFESVHFWDHGDKPLIIDTPNDGRVVMTGESHMPSPTKVIWAVNANLLGVAKWHYNQIANTLPRHELWVAQDSEWNMTCEYADIVFPVDSWVEFKHPDMTASCTNPFVQIFPRGGIPRIHNTRHDIEVFANVAKALGEQTGEERFIDYWKFVHEGNVEVYIQRIIDASNGLRGYNVREMLAADTGFLVMFRTYPRVPGWEQIQESKPFWTRTGRLELYRDEDEWIDQGENLIVHREPIEATPYQPRVIVAPKDFLTLRPRDYGITDEVTDGDAKALYNKMMTTGDLVATENPLRAKGLVFTLSTPKPRHRTHSSWGSSDWNVIWASNFGDPYRRDQRMPWVGEEEVDMHPEDGMNHGISDGDYVWVDADPADRPYIGFKESDPFYEVARLKIRVHFNNALPKGMLMIIHGGAGATHKSVQAQKTNADGSSLTSTGYTAAFRNGSQQSTVRGYLQPTQMTESLVHKDYFTNHIKQGFQVDTHTPTGAPKEVLVKITKAEDGGLDGEGIWAPANRGTTPGSENENMKRFLSGGFIS